MVYCRRTATGGLGHSPRNLILYLDVPMPTTPGQSALSAPGTFKESEASSNIWANLAPGTHTLGVQLIQNDHTPFNPPVFATISVTIKEPVVPTTPAVISPTTAPPAPDGKTWLRINPFIAVTILIALVVLAVTVYLRRKEED